MLYQGSIYLTTSEFYGSGSNRAPSVYWAIVEPGNLATGAITVHGAGIIASKDGMVLGFPVIAALSSGDGAVIAYAYAKSGEVNGVGPAYPGELCHQLIDHLIDRRSLLLLLPRNQMLINRQAGRLRVEKIWIHKRPQCCCRKSCVRSHIVHTNTHTHTHTHSLLPFITCTTRRRCHHHGAQLWPHRHLQHRHCQAWGGQHHNPSCA